MKTAPIIISLGGSLIVPKTGIDIAFLSEFKKIILARVAKGDRFILICGGGAVCRQYQNAAAELGKLSRESLDWMGIHVTRLNAHLVRMIFLDHAFPRVVTDPKGGKKFTQAIMVAAGWKPGCSTDFDAVLQASQQHVKYMYNLSNTDYVYDRDPNVHADAKPYKDMSWSSLRKIVGDSWDPGMHVPFDPIAAKRAEKIGLEVRIVNGKNLKNFSKALAGENFVGTRIHP